jgi:L-asparaginase II
MPSEVLAESVRGSTVESIHRGHFIVLDGDGKVVRFAGEPRTVTFLRSACKPFQTIPLITSGAVEAFGFTDEEVALACASHSGEPRHLAIVQRMLEKIGMSEADLRCGSHMPFNAAESERLMRAGQRPTQLHNNCSGKHAAMLALAKHIGTSTKDYDDADHRVQRRILRCISDMTETPVGNIGVGIDGCAVPNYAVSVTAMARSFLKLIHPVGLHPAVQRAVQRVASVMLRYPELIGGSERLDTMLMQAARGRLISKVGADGVWCGAVLPHERYSTGLAMALKIEDGDDLFSRPVVVVQLLRSLGILANDDLLELSPMPIKNRRGEVVGHIRCTPMLNR